MASAYPQVWHGLVATGTRQPLKWFEKAFVLSVCLADVNLALPFDEVEDAVRSALSACGMDTELASKMYNQLGVEITLRPLLLSVVQGAREPTRGLFFCHLMKVADSLCGLPSDLTACFLVYSFHSNQMNAGTLIDWIFKHAERGAVSRLSRAGLDWQRFIWGMAQEQQLWLNAVFTCPKVLGELDPDDAPAELLAFYYLPFSTQWCPSNHFDVKQWQHVVAYDLMKTDSSFCFSVEHWFSCAVTVVTAHSFQDKERILAGVTNVAHVYASLSGKTTPYPGNVVLWVNRWLAPPS